MLNSENLKASSLISPMIFEAKNRLQKLVVENEMALHFLDFDPDCAQCGRKLANIRIFKDFRNYFDTNLTNNNAFFALK